MLIHEFDLARIHNSALLAEVDEERLARIAQSARRPRAHATSSVARVALIVQTAVAVAVRALPIGG
jgi:hypothetical protein